jgi:stage V sporulation protein B
VGLITGSLQSTGLSAAGATAAYGQLTGIAVPLLYLPTVFIFPLTTALLPSVAATAVRSPARLRKQVNGLLGVAVAVGIGAAIGLLVTSEWLATAVFEVPGAAHLIALVAVVAPAAYVEFVTTSVLNGLGETGVVFEHTAAGMLVRLALLQLLVTRPELGISGALYAYAAGHGLTAALNLTEVYRQVVLSQRAPSRI